MMKKIESEVTMQIANAKRDGNDVVITVDIAVGKPSEPYASLDFNLVSSDREQLEVIDLDDREDITDLDVNFASGYGSAYHGGRDYDDTEGYSYLMGIYSQSAGNQITDATNVCSVNLRYSGDEDQSLQIRDMKLVYIDENGAVLSSPIDSDATLLTINESIVTQIGDNGVPLGSPSGEVHPAWWIVLGVVIVCAVVAIVKKKRLERNINEES